jgi:hypothetical protein
MTTQWRKHLQLACQLGRTQNTRERLLAYLSHGANNVKNFVNGRTLVRIHAEHALQKHEGSSRDFLPRVPRRQRAIQVLAKLGALVAIGYCPREAACATNEERVLSESTCATQRVKRITNDRGLESPYMP